VVELPDFQKKQYAFAAHIRDPEHNAGPDDVEDRRFLKNCMTLKNGARWFVNS